MESLKILNKLVTSDTRLRFAVLLALCVLGAEEYLTVFPVKLPYNSVARIYFDVDSNLGGGGTSFTFSDFWDKTALHMLANVPECLYCR